MEIPSYPIEEENIPFEILNPDSTFRIVSLHVPYQLTYEVITGTTSEDYLNALTLSEQGAYLFKERADEHIEKNLHVPLHTHDYYEMMIVLEGTVSQSIEDNVYLYDAGTVCFLNRNLSHQEHFSGSARILFLGFSLAYLKDLFKEIKASGFPAEQAFFESKVFRFIQHDMQHSGEKAYLDFMPTKRQQNSQKVLHDLCDLLMNTLMKPHFGASMLVDGILASIISYISDPENYHCTNVELKSSGDYLLFMRIEHLLEESDGCLTRAELSEILHYSGDYISRIVKKYSGLSLHDYSLKFSLRKASYLLIHTNKPITSILADLGFTNRTYFYKVFAQQYGMTPREYRMQTTD